MRGTIGAVAILCLLAGNAIAQTESAASPADSLKSAFESGTVDGKLAALSQSTKYSADQMEQLYVTAIDFILRNYAKVKSDPSGQKLALITAKLVGTTKLEAAASLLWQLFNADPDDAVRQTVLSSLAQTATGKTDVISRMNLWLATQDNLFRNGSEVDLPVVAACVQALGSLSDPTSFPVLFSTAQLKYPKEVAAAAAQAVDSFKGNLPDLLVSVVLNNPLGEKSVALSFAVASATLTPSEKALVAVAALKVALAGGPSAAEEKAATSLRFAAAGELAALAWAPATDLLIQNFDSTLAEYGRGTLPVEDLIESISGLGSMGTHEAAVRLSLYLDLIGTYVQRGQSVNQSVVLAVINSLSRLQDPVAIENLLSVQSLSYPDAVKRAAREAVDNLQSHDEGA